MSRKRVVTMIIVALSLFIVLYFGLNGSKSFRQAVTDPAVLENIYYIVQIMVGFTAIIGAIIAIWQYVLSVRTENVNIKNGRIEKAIDLSGYYKDNILNKMVALRYIFEESGVKACLDKINTTQMREFDGKELDKILDKSTKKQIQGIMNSKKMVDVIIKAVGIYNIQLDTKISVSDMESLDEREVKHIVSCVVNDILNNMEYFALYFTHKIADETVVFQSLHQTYIECVQLLYYNIAINNQPNGRQFYTNVVQLYAIWNGKAENNENRHTESGRKTSRGNVAEIELA